MFTMLKPYQIEFCWTLSRTARNREPDVSLEMIAADFGINSITFWTWLKKPEIGDCVKSGVASAESVELCEANRQVRVLKQEAEVFKAGPV